MWRWLLVALIFLISFFGLSYYAAERNEYLKAKVYDEGHESFNDGVPVTANPYQNTEAYWSVIWLNGWRSAARKSKAMSEVK